MNVTGSNYTLRIDSVSHLTHKFSNRFLLIVAITTKVVSNIEIDFAIKRVPCRTSCISLCSRLRSALLHALCLGVRRN